MHIHPLPWGADKMTYLLRVFFLSFIIALFCTPSDAYAQLHQQRILIGILPEMNVFKQSQRFKLLGEYISRQIGVPVEFTILSRYGDLIDRFTTEKMDGAFFGSFTGAQAIKKLGVIPLARPVDLDGTSTYHGYLFVRKDSGIKGIKDMKNRKMAFVEKSTTAGYLFPQAYLRDNGISDPNQFFSGSFFAGSHDGAVSAVLNRKADVGAAKNSIYDQLRKDDPRVDRELLILAKSTEVPSNGLCVRKGLDETLKRKLKNVLVDLHLNPDGKLVLKQFGAIRFIETTASDYLPVFDMAKRAGIDVMTYDNRNR